jgi:hypothetical protein
VAGCGPPRLRFARERTLGQRSIVVVDVDRISDSCGFAVPLMEFHADRDVLERAHERRDQDRFDRYWRTRNAESIDGLPALG